MSPGDTAKAILGMLIIVVSACVIHSVVFSLMTAHWTYQVVVTSCVTVFLAAMLVHQREESETAKLLAGGVIMLGCACVIFGVISSLLTTLHWVVHAILAICVASFLLAWSVHPWLAEVPRSTAVLYITARCNTFQPTQTLGQVLQLIPHHFIAPTKTVYAILLCLSGMLLWTIYNRKPRTRRSWTSKWVLSTVFMATACWLAWHRVYPAREQVTDEELFINAHHNNQSVVFQEAFSKALASCLKKKKSDDLLDEQCQEFARRVTTKIRDNYPVGYQWSSAPLPYIEEMYVQACLWLNAVGCSTISFPMARQENMPCHAWGLLSIWYTGVLGYTGLMMGPLAH